MWYHVYVNRTCYQVTQDESWVKLFSLRQRRAGNKVEIKRLERQQVKRPQWAS